MNKELAQVIKAYSTLSHKELNVLLIDKSKDNIIAILIDLLTQYFNDKNSSTLRQFLIVTMSGYEMNPEKIGYNGYRQSGIGQPKEYCEAKPKNVNTSDKKLKRLNGDGNFTDYTWARFKKDKKTNPQMIVGGFVDGKLIYIFEFPFKTKSFTDRLQYQLKNHFPHGYERGRFLRSASFSFKHYKDYRNLKTTVFVSREELNRLKKYFSKGLLAFISEIKTDDKK